MKCYKCFFYLAALTSICGCNDKSENSQSEHRGPKEGFVTDNPITHDPVMAKEGDTYYVFATGNGVSVMESKDLKNWTYKKPCIDELPKWLKEKFPGASMHLWAPDIFFKDGKWHLYYSSSAFGKNTSLIGHLTTTTLSNPQWKDEGSIIQSIPGRDMWNAIDPNIVAGDDGKMWLVFGSFWDGIMLVKLNDNLSAIAEPQEWHRVAHRQRSEFLDAEEPGDGAIEAPFIFKKNGWYYLFVSLDYCCRGSESTYKVAVGRSKNVTGPYLDRNGVSMDKGGGTIVVEGDGKMWQAIGHCSVYTIDGHDIYVSHAYDFEDGTPHLVVKDLCWDDEWPVLKF
ncbi:MAG: family 43 glycosylhydrolase [Bacteroidales bacterium]|nr:family 43 glycosylhydrolase [Bacteroidales bacterium]